MKSVQSDAYFPRSLLAPFAELRWCAHVKAIPKALFTLCITGIKSTLIILDLSRVSKNSRLLIAFSGDPSMRQFRFYTKLKSHQTYNVLYLIINIHVFTCNLKLKHYSARVYLNICSKSNLAEVLQGLILTKAVRFWLKYLFGNIFHRYRCNISLISDKSFIVLSVKNSLLFNYLLSVRARSDLFNYWCVQSLNNYQRVKKHFSQK